MSLTYPPNGSSDAAMMSDSARQWTFALIPLPCGDSASLHVIVVSGVADANDGMQYSAARSIPGIKRVGLIAAPCGLLNGGCPRSAKEQVKRRQNDATELATRAHFGAFVLVPKPPVGRLSRPKRRLTGAAASLRYAARAANNVAAQW